MKGLSVIVLIGILLVMGSCNIVAGRYQSTVDTAVARTWDNVDKVVDTAVSPKPLEDTMALHSQVTGKDNRIWMAFAMFFFLVLSVAAIFGFIYLRAKQEQATAKRMRAERSLTKASSANNYAVQPPPNPEWITNVSPPPQLPPTAQTTPRARLSLPINSSGNEGVSWTK